MFSITLSPRFLETDALGHINNTVLPMWFEAGRDPVFRLFTPDMDVNNWCLIIAKFSVSFHAETLYGTDVEIKTFIGRIGNSSFEVVQECWQNGIKTASGTLTMVHFDHKEKQSMPIPESIKQLLKQHLIEQ
ncbi:MAG: acyl-CoA thioesterase [Psychrobium sp.]|nr:acyl-CoA thioesterase [Psychrobium sp.]